ncbi:16S rRNA (adenine1518-N6/adenine1519-N6)-dimethyltransferase [Methylomarinovum caldicuralii]|uniref:Ribosomal RNA small subunit methyltransferase A n=1 Tax=Methylomarinovum caldicuralii TaxID=438856 RepID=A0AAU9CMB0_9GAMM|nr:16S rRNA (adenine(1518)-N(6)/adenine(1519)-N(6))-dimethyltransferase RsmA [Methylomarinovum caldicuralii]BCX82816.1 16S rRNA (adenine1518-N6/adenine1519-N6)-dimethyltransferase [Methylomarinovum caldicuralii]
MHAPPRPRKRFGQNFLQDGRVIQRIVTALDPRADDHVVEIGPGRGALTRHLLDRCRRLEVVEIDRDLAALLREKFATAANLVVHEADALAFDFSALAAPGEQLKVVGNLPYNISTPLLFHLFGQQAVISQMLFMLQKEVVERLAAVPGSKTYGRLSVMTQYHCRIEKCFNVKPACFQPPPKVMSAVVRLTPHPRPPVGVGAYSVFETVVAKAFGQRRKTLRNALRGLLEADAIAACGVDPAARAETLPLEAFAALSRTLYSLAPLKR